MPLPHSGAGETLPGGPAAARSGSPASASLSRQETLFGLSPEQLLGGPVRPAAPKPAAPKPAAPAKADGARTFFGVAPPGVYPEHRPQPAPVSAEPLAADGAPAPPGSPAPHRTLLGVMSDDMAKAVALAREAAGPVLTPARGSTTAPLHSPPQPAQPSFGAVRGGTIVGGDTPPAAQRLAAHPPAPAHTAFEAPPTPTGTVRSLVGDTPGIARVGVPAAAESLEVEPDAEPAAPGTPAPAPPIHASTQLGVAIPGVAPLRAGIGSSRPAPAPRAMLDATQLQPDSLATAPLSTRAGTPRGAFVLLGSGLVLLLAAVTFALLWQGSKPLSVAISTDASGKDRLDIVCAECPDGTLVSLDAERAEVRARKAYLSLPEPLPLGENEVRFGLQKPGAREPEAVRLTLPPVEYRIRPDTSTLVGDRPQLTLKLSAIPGSTVEIAGRPVALDPASHGEVAVDVSSELLGPASEVVRFEQSIAYRIEPPSGKTYAGELALEVGVTPLLLEAPGIDTVTDLERFMLAGRTTRGAELWVAGTTIAVDDEGRFAQLMSIDSVGETRVTVRATAPGLAPRFVSFRLQRVEDLASEAATRRQKAIPLARAHPIADHIGSSVLVSGRVEEVRMDGHRTLLILSPEARCNGRACLVRLVYGGLRKLSRGDTITAIGRLQGVVPAAAGAGGDVPEVDVALLR